MKFVLLSMMLFCNLTWAHIGGVGDSAGGSKRSWDDIREDHGLTIDGKQVHFPNGSLLSIVDVCYLPEEDVLRSASKVFTKDISKIYRYSQLADAREYIYRTREYTRRYPDDKCDYCPPITEYREYPLEAEILLRKQPTRDDDHFGEVAFKKRFVVPDCDEIDEI